MCHASGNAEQDPQVGHAAELWRQRLLRVILDGVEGVEGRVVVLWIIWVVHMEMT